MFWRPSPFVAAELWKFIDKAVALGEKKGIMIGANTSYGYSMKEMRKRVNVLHDHGVKFISYAVWWVRQGVLKALAEQVEVHVRQQVDPGLTTPRRHHRGDVRVDEQCHELVGTGRLRRAHVVLLTVPQADALDDVEAAPSQAGDRHVQPRPERWGHSRARRGDRNRVTGTKGGGQAGVHGASPSGAHDRVECIRTMTVSAVSSRDTTLLRLT